MVDLAGDPDREGPRSPQPLPLAVGTVVALLGWASRTWVRDGAAPLVWNDSADYVTAATAPIFSLARLAGPRAPGMPTVLAMSGNDLTRFVTIQTVIAAVAWGILAATMATIVDRRWLQWLGAALVLGLSTTWPATMWDQQVLTESLALSTLALLTAALLHFAARTSPSAGAWVVVAAVASLAVRDSTVVPVALIGAAMVVATVRVPPMHRRAVLGTGALLMGSCVLSIGASHHGGRERVPIEHVYAVRVLPFPERVAWFAERGMPDEVAASLPLALDPAGERAPFVAVPVDPEWEEWRRWVSTSGRATWLRYVLTHPTYLASEPLEQPERVFNNGDGLSTYRPLPMRSIPWTTPLLHPPTWIAVVLAGAASMAAAWGWRSSRRSRPLTIVGTTLVVTAAPHALLVWHSDGMESARHLLVPGIQVRLGVVVLLVAALQCAADGRGATGTAPSPPVRSSDRPQARPRRGG